MTSKHPLRKSCAFCRARKIKCSNEVICEACRRQGDDCIYDFEHPRRKSRNLSVDSTASGLSPLRARRAGSRKRSCSAGSACSTPGSVYVEETGNGETIAGVLEGMFLLCPPVHAMLSTDSSTYSCLLPLLTQHIVGRVVLENISQPSPQPQQSETMFDMSSPSDPLSEYGLRQRTQLIDVWYSMHPLSFLVSKTLLLRELRDGTQDDILLAAMMAYAQQVIGDDTCIAKGDALFAWAASQLRTRSRNIKADARVGASTRVYAGVSTVQSLILLAWNSLWASQFRRTTCYLDLAREMIFEIKDTIGRSSPPSSSRINGVDVVDVEKEIVSYLDWTAFSLSLWMSLEKGTRNLTAPTELPSTDASSAMIQLDLVSENLGTLQRQRSVIREMWPLTCIVSMTSRVLNRVDHSVNSEFANVGLQYLQEQPDAASRNLVLVFYHTLNIHLLFPYRQPREPTRSIVSSETIDGFLSSAHSILRLVTVSQRPSTPFSAPCSLNASFPDAISLALETCASAIEYIYSCLHPDMSESCIWQMYGERIRVMTEMLHKASREDHLNQGAQIRHARKQLKACARALGSASTPATGGLPTPDLGFMSLSERRMSIGECQMAQETHANFSFFGELPSLSSSMPSSTVSSLETPIVSFSEASKPLWVFDQPDDMQNCVPQLEGSGNDMSAGGMWCPQISVAMDFATESAPMQFAEWEWPTMDNSSERLSSGYGRFSKSNAMDTGL